MTKPIMPWIGGKTRLLKHLMPLVPAHITYCEVFAGGAAMLMAKEPSKAEVLNDINGELVNLYRVVQHHLAPFIDCYKWALSSRTMFEWEKMKVPETLTDIQRAARFFYLQKLAFGGVVKNQTYGVDKKRPARFNLLRIEEDLSAAHLRLINVAIEHLPWQKCFSKYDSPDTFFFCDPPYWKTEGYGAEFPWEEYVTLLEWLKCAKGKVLITLNDHQSIRRLFKGYILDQHDIKYSVSQSTQKAATELFIANYKVD